MDPHAGQSLPFRESRPWSVPRTGAHLHHMAKLRPYRRDDLPDLAEVWNQTFLGTPNFVRLDETDFTRRTVGQPSFDPGTLLVAAQGSRIQGFVHFGPRTNLWSEASARRANPREGQIRAVATATPDPVLERDLLAAAVDRLAEAGAHKVLLGPSWVYGAQPFYNGIAGAYESPGLSTERGDLLDVAAEAGFAPVAEYATPEIDFAEGEHLETLHTLAGELWRSARQWGLQVRRRALSSPFFPDRALVELVLDLETIAVTAFGPWPEYAREYGRRLFGLTNVQVAPRWRGKGLGKLVVIQAIEAARDAGADGVHLHVWKDNRAAWDLYHRALGFRSRYTWVTLARTLPS